jgi:small subunit ribosomal protein S9
MANTEFIWGTGRRKTSIARVRIAKGDGKIVINERPIEQYFSLSVHKDTVTSPMQVTNTVGKYDIFVNVKGGGNTGQSEAILLGIARAICKDSPTLESKLRSYGYLTRDSRMVERKKYGRKKARRSFQWTKR